MGNVYVGIVLEVAPSIIWMAPCDTLPGPTSMILGRITISSGRALCVYRPHHMTQGGRYQRPTLRTSNLFIRQTNKAVRIEVLPPEICTNYCVSSKYYVTFQDTIQAPRTSNP
jgi:hypothetical protein